ncbi:MAG TPA: glycosyltransferase [Saprospiraceae bacterium]|nr:glycosyltransferase [Saprospiraceae bacterium]
MKPFISFLYPTRDRPSFLERCLFSMSKLSFIDFEIIITDNSINKSALQVYELYKIDTRIKYFSTGGNLSMSENYNYALSLAKGEYVSALTDKLFMKKNSLEIIYKIVKEHDLDLLNWRESTFALIDEDKSLEEGFIYTLPVKNDLIFYNPKEELKYLIDFKKHRVDDIEKYYRGKLFIGCAKREKIGDYLLGNKFFQIYAPDYTTRTILLSKIEKCAEITLPLQSSIQTKTSNGARCAKYPDAAFQFFYESDKFEIADKFFPIRGLYTSQQNHVAGDYNHILTKLESDLRVNEKNLMKTIPFDLLNVEWPSQRLKKEHWGLFFSHVKKLGLKLYLEIIFIVILKYYFKIQLKRIRKGVVRLFASFKSSGQNDLKLVNRKYFSSFAEAIEEMNKQII